MTVTNVEAVALAATVTTRIRVLWQQRQRDKRVVYHTPARHDRDVELRALIRLGRSARRLARRMEERDAVTLAKGYHDWQAAGPVSEPELIAGYGATDRFAGIRR
jgi:hypothetical protein